MNQLQKDYAKTSGHLCQLVLLIRLEIPLLQCSGSLNISYNPDQRILNSGYGIRIREANKLRIRLVDPIWTFKKIFYQMPVLKN